jgi:pimeloyl-ACP methyl ester carboxylesterase
VTGRAPTERHLHVGGRSTRLLDAGSGTAVLWLHDTRGNGWTPGHARLAEHHRVVAPSLPGFDDSTTLDGIDGPQDVVFWLLDLLDDLQLERPAVLGCGLGGWMAAELAVRYPERLARLVLVDAYGLRLPGALAEDEFALTPAMLRPLLFGEPGSELALATVPDTEPAASAERALHARVAAARLAWQFPYNPKLHGWLRRARVPTLVVWGERDQLVRPAHGEAYVAALPDAKLAVLPGAGHYPYLDAPDPFADVVTAFLQ